MSSFADTVSKLSSNKAVTSVAESRGLKVLNVTWEDCARNMASCWGPNITDMTLKSCGKNMPVFRKPNLSDVTADRSISDFTVMVGNENGLPLKQITLKEYLENIQKYTGNSKMKRMLWTSKELQERGTDEEQILTCPQACVLPLQDGSVEFCVQMYNYQSNYDSEDPAILVVMSSAQGTSAQVVYGQTSVYLNDDGNAHMLKAERLSDDRKKRGVSVNGPMTDEEKNRNALFVYQIPLKQKERPQARYSYAACAFGGPMLECAMPYSSEDEECAAGLTFRNKKKCRGFERAVISKGEYVGQFEGTKDLALERDPRYPIRCTVQYYNVTDTQDITPEQIFAIADMVEKPYLGAKAVGTHVFGESNRTTKPDLAKAQVSFSASSVPLVKF